MFHTPILFLVFNRLDTTKLVFEEIRKAKPPRLYVASDGSRDNNPDEDEKVLSVRNYVLNNIDWDCKVKTLFRENNLGCGKAVSEAITWFFENEEMGIILEDDCLPSKSFFNFCQELLEYYRNNKKIMHIGGSNFQFGKKHGRGSYYFSIYAEMWGWATWRRAWNFYDFNMNTYSEFLNDNKLLKISEIKEVQDYWYRIMTRTFHGNIDTWDYQWIYTVWNQNGLCIIPNVNLISNIGFRSDGTHTFDIKHHCANIPTNDIINFIHIDTVKVCKKADIFHTHQRFVRKNTFISKMKKYLLYFYSFLKKTNKM